MGWADHAIAELQAGRSVQIRPAGRSMEPKVPHRSLVTLIPVEDPQSLAKGDIVLVKVGRSVYLHLISAVDRHRVQISNNHGRVNGWVPRTAVYGIATRVQP